MRTTIFALAALALMTSPLAARAGDSPLVLAKAQTFTVERVHADGSAQIGSGVIVGRDAQTLIIATAAEFARLAGTLRILDSSRAAYYDVLGIRVLPDYDLAFVRVRAQASFRIAAATFAPAREGERVWVWGNRADAALTSATVRDAHARIPTAWGSARVTIVCDACSDGDAGAGVFDERGGLVGIITKKWAHASDALALFIEVEPSTLLAQEALVPIESSNLAVDSHL